RENGAKDNDGDRQLDDGHPAPAILDCGRHSPNEVKLRTVILPSSRHAFGRRPTPKNKRAPLGGGALFGESPAFLCQAEFLVTGLNQ
ncbi:MAG: hypothetical protein RLN70_02500, partial [Rhodospirillaceae bacterium]